MRVMLVGVHQQIQGEFGTALEGVLERLGHDILRPFKHSVADCDLLVAFVDDRGLEVPNFVQDAAEYSKPVLCLTDGRNPVQDYFVEAGRVGEIELTSYRDFDDLADKVMRYAIMIGRCNNRLARQTVH